MSGPIVRRYGFPNFDRIFGKKEIQHGVDEPVATDQSQGTPSTKDEPTDPAPKPAPPAGK